MDITAMAALNTVQPDFRAGMKCRRKKRAPTLRVNKISKSMVLVGTVVAMVIFIEVPVCKGFSPSSTPLRYEKNGMGGSGLTTRPSLVPSTNRGVPCRNARMPEEGDMAPIRTKATEHDIATGRDPERLRIFDTTLRDGEQAPGCSMSVGEKLAIAQQLVNLQVDTIEAGFPIASEGDFESVKSIAAKVGSGENPPIICALARTTRKDIEAAAESLKPARFPRIHTFIACSDIHMEHKLKKTRSEIIEIVRETVSYAHSLVKDIEFSAEDALRSDPPFLAEVFSVAIESGASTINVPDTVGYSTPDEFKALVHYLRRNVRGIENAIISVHGHDDLGLACSNFLSAIEGGARQAECTINGIGERAGNAAMEEVVMSLHVRKPYFNRFWGRPETSTKPLTNINMSEIYKTSRLVSSMTGMVVQGNKAIVGANAFAHESGIHQDGVLKNRETYEIMDSELVGIKRQNAGLSLGKLSGRHAFKTHLENLGYTLSETDLNRSFTRFKKLADKKKVITELELQSIANSEVSDSRENGAKIFRLKNIQVITGNNNIPAAVLTITNLQTGKNETVCGIGKGPVDAIFKAVNVLVQKCSPTVTGSGEDGILGASLEEYLVDSVTAGIDALGIVTVRLRDDLNDGLIIYGKYADTDVLYASARAYLQAVDKMVLIRMKRNLIQPAKQRSG